MRNLRQTTLSAIRSGRDQRELNAKRERKSQNQAQRIASKAILRKLPNTAFKAALDGEKYALVMSADDVAGIILRVGARESKWLRRKGRIPSELLAGTARIVFDACAKAGLEPKVVTKQAAGLSNSLSLVMLIPVRKK